MELWKRISINPDVLMGQPAIAGTRLSVQFILGLLAKGMNEKEILTEYPYITKEDILACRLYG